MNVRSVGVVLALVGLVVLAHPLYLYPHHGENAYYLSNVERVGEQSPADTIAYDELPPVAQDRFEQGLSDDHADEIWTGEHAASYRALAEHEYVSHRGDYYDYRLRGVDDFGDGIDTVLRMLLSTLAVVALVTGGFVARTEQFRPLTPLRAVWIPLGVFVALVATRYYDVTFSGAHEPPSYVHLQAMAAALVSASVVGSAVRDRRSLRPLAPVALLAAAGTAFAVASGHGSAVGSGLVAFGALTGPWFAVGYLLTAPRNPATRGATEAEK